VHIGCGAGARGGAAPPIMVFECVGAEYDEACIITNSKGKGMLLMKQSQDGKVTQSP